MIETIMFLLVFLGGGGTDLLGTVDTDTYWKTKEVTVSVQQLMRDAKPEAGAADIAQQIKDLGSARFATRDAARKEILRVGAPAIEMLKAATTDKDPEVSAAARGLIATLELQSKAREIRQLMAIRTLGEKKAAEATALLKELSGSDTPFVAQYARQSLAQIEGRAVAAAAVDPKAADADVWLMPAGCGLIAQQSAGMGGGITVSTFIDMAAPAEEGAEGAAQKEKLKQGAGKVVIALLDRIGDVRVDTVSLGISSTVDDDHGFMVVTVRGQWDKKGMAEALRDGLTEDGNDPLIDAIGAVPPANKQPVIHGIAPPIPGGPQHGPIINVGPGGFPAEVPGAGDASAKRGPMDLKGPVVLRGPDSAAIVVSDEQLVFISATDDDLPKITQKMAEAVKAGKGGVGDDKEMSGALAQADRTLPVWGVAHISQSYKALELLAPFQSMRVSGVLGDHGVDLSLEAEAADEAAALAGGKKVMDTINDAVKSLAQIDAAGGTPAMEAMGKALSVMLRKIEVKTQARKTTVTAKLSERDIFTILLQMDDSGDILDMLTAPPDDEVNPGIPGNINPGGPMMRPGNVVVPVPAQPPVGQPR